jgi:tetratricopeptide (TPR) repeat protein
VIRALSAIGQGTREANTEAERLCRRAIEIAPQYGQPHSLLGWVLLRRSMWTADLRTLVPEVNAEGAVALSLDDRDPWAHLVQGLLHNRLRGFDEAARAVRKALELNPNFALAHAFLAAALAFQGLHQEAIDSAQHALRLSPNDRSVGLYASLGSAIAHFSLGHYSESSTWARLAIEKGPGHVGPQSFLTAAMAMQGELTAAARARDALLALRPDFSLTWMKENLPPTGKLAERLCEGLRRAGVPET